MRLLLSSCLQAMGIEQVKPFSHGGEAIDYLRALKKQPMRGGVECVIADLQMPVVDGLMLLRWVRRSAESPNRFLPFLMITAHSDSQRVCEARDLGVTEFLTKPFSVEQLARKIVNVIEHPRQFVQSSDYFGPDRRRQTREIAFAERRVLNERSPNVEVVYE